MADKKDKVFAPLFVKERKAPFGMTYKISGKADEVAEFIQKNANARGYINLEMLPRKAASEKGITHNVVLDTWEPQSKDASATPVVDPNDEDPFA